MSYQTESIEKKLSAAVARMDELTYLPNLPQLEWVQTLRDPIWGEIPITAVERKIIQTEAFYRLRGIKQLSFAYLAFPGAVHSRFEHSLGVMHATDMLLKMVCRHPWGEGTGIRSFARQTLRLSALLHDIGHPPFSHAMECLCTHYPDLLESIWGRLPPEFLNFLHDHGKDKAALGRHEVFTEYLICTDSDIQEILKGWVKDERRGSLAPRELASHANVFVQEIIAKLAVGEMIDAHQAPGDLAPLIWIFKSIMSGDIDADKIDYLMRDNYYCGLPHGLDLASLRNNLNPLRDGLEIKQDAIRFVYSLILARYRLITEVHHEKWNVFATAKAIELLNTLLHKNPDGAKLFFDIFTRWGDSELLRFLLQSNDQTIKAILTTQFPLQELARLEFLETHPFIRECIQILSEPMNHAHIPRLQRDLRRAVGKDDLFVHVQSVKSPEFSMQLADGGGNLLRNEILRGISEESIKNLHVIVYGGNDFTVNLSEVAKQSPELLPCETCHLAKDCVKELRDSRKKLLAEVAVHRYRRISQQCGSSKIIAADFLLLIMEEVSRIVREQKIEHPIRQTIYHVARMIYNEVRGKISIHGTIGLTRPRITSSFYQEIRKYEQLGLIAYSREIRKLLAEEKQPHYVFRFDRRFQLSEFGRMRLAKVRQLNDKIPEYREYIKSWLVVQEAMERKRSEIIEILAEQKEGEKQP